MIVAVYYPPLYGTYKNGAPMEEDFGPKTNSKSVSMLSPYATPAQMGLDTDTTVRPTPATWLPDKNLNNMKFDNDHLDADAVVPYDYKVFTDPAEAYYIKNEYAYDVIGPVATDPVKEIPSDRKLLYEVEFATVADAEDAYT